MEIWKDVIGFEGAYQVSNFGNAKSVDRKVKHNFGGLALKKGKLLKLIPDKDGYLRVNLKRQQKTNNRIVHRLVASAFIDNPENKPQVNHKNGIKNDNRVENIEWCTTFENRQHAYDTGLQNSFTRQGEKNNFNKLREEDVRGIRLLYNKKNGFTQKRLSEIYGVTQSCVWNIIKNKTWKQLA